MPVNFGILQQMVAPKVVGEIQSQPEESGGGLGDLLSGLRALVGSPSAPTMGTSEQSPFNAMYGSQYNAPSLQQEAIANTLGFRHGGRTDPTQLIFHDTAGPTFQSAANTLKERGLSYNYIIDKDGTIHNLVPPGTKAFHAKGYNDRTIGISFVGGGGHGQVTPAQQKASVALAMNLKKQFPALSGFAGHKDRSHAGKIDPEGFDYDSFASATGLPFMQSPSFNAPSSKSVNNTNLGQTSPSNQSSTPVNQYMKAAQTGARNVYKDNPVMADIATAQAILESNLANKPSGLALKNNFFGIKGKGTGGSANMPTWEVINGRKVNIKAPFAVNATPEDSFTQHYNLMQKPRYKAVREAKTFEEAADAMGKSGYATDPNYSKKLKQIYLKYLKTSDATPNGNPVLPQQPTPQEHKTYEDAVRALDNGRDSYASLTRLDGPGGNERLQEPTYSTMPVLSPTSDEPIQGYSPEMMPYNTYVRDPASQQANNKSQINWGLLKSIIERA